MRLRRLPWVTLAIALAALASHALFPLSSALAYAGYTPGSHDLVRLVGCHLVHYSSTHLAWDVSTFVALGTWSELRSRPRFVLFLACAALLVPPLACALTPWLRCYAGLSGLVLGTVAVALGTRLSHDPRRMHRWLGSGLLLGLLVKQLYELWIGNTSLVTFVYEGFTTVPAAHLISVLIGACVGVSNFFIRSVDGVWVGS